MLHPSSLFLSPSRDQPTQMIPFRAFEKNDVARPHDLAEVFTGSIDGIEGTE